MTRDEAIETASKVYDLVPIFLPGKKMEWRECNEINPGYWVVVVWVRKRPRRLHPWAHRPDLVISEPTAIAGSVQSTTI